MICVMKMMLFCILTIAEYLTFFYVIFGKRLNDQNFKRISETLILNCVLISIVSYVGISDLIIIFSLIMSIVCVNVVYNLLWKDTICQFIVSFLLLSILESVIGYILNFFLEEDSIVISNIYLVIIIAIFWIYYFIKGKKNERDFFVLPNKMNIIISFFLLTIVSMYTYFTYALTEILRLGRGLTGVMLVLASGVLIFITFLLMIYYFNVQKKYQIENDILEKFNEQQRKHFELLLQKEQKTRQFRHNIINEFMQIKNYAENQNYLELQRYVSETLQDISSISQYDYDVGNETVNVILNYYLLPLKGKCKIRVKGVIQNELGISDRDLSIIVYNLVTNAVEAVEKINRGEKYIKFNVKQGKIFTFITLKNSYINEKINYVGGKILTSKNDKKNHGFGLKSVKNIVEKNGGEVKYQMLESEFLVEIRLKK